MKRNIFFCFLCIFSLLNLLNGIAWAELQFKCGSSFRLRHEYWKNWKDMDNDQKDNRNFFRVKSSLWGQWDYDKSLSLYAKLTN